MRRHAHHKKGGAFFVNKGKKSVTQTFICPAEEIYLSGTTAGSAHRFQRIHTFKLSDSNEAVEFNDAYQLYKIEKVVVELEMQPNVGEPLITTDGGATNELTYRGWISQGPATAAKPNADGTVLYPTGSTANIQDNNVQVMIAKTHKVFNAGDFSQATASPASTRGTFLTEARMGGAALFNLQGNKKRLAYHMKKPGVQQPTFIDVFNTHEEQGEITVPSAGGDIIIPQNEPVRQATLGSTMLRSTFLNGDYSNVQHFGCVIALENMNAVNAAYPNSHALPAVRIIKTVRMTVRFYGQQWQGQSALGRAAIQPLYRGRLAPSMYPMQTNESQLFGTVGLIGNPDGTNNPNNPWTGAPGTTPYILSFTTGDRVARPTSPGVLLGKQVGIGVMKFPLSMKQYCDKRKEWLDDCLQMCFVVNGKFYYDLTQHLVPEKKCLSEFVPCETDPTKYFSIDEIYQMYGWALPMLFNDDGTSFLNHNIVQESIAPA